MRRYTGWLARRDFLADTVVTIVASCALRVTFLGECHAAARTDIAEMSRRFAGRSAVCHRLAGCAATNLR